MDQTFFNNANLSDQITIIGEAEHLLYHALKSASVKAGTEDEVFFLALAKLAKEFRRNYMKRHFPDTPDELWCALKSVDTLRQRVYEATEYDANELSEVDTLWNMVASKVTGEDLSGCSACREDKNSSE